MSTPTQPVPEQAETVRAEIAGFVAAVERELDDLPADDVADLLGGLEADLTDAWAAEGTTPTQRLGSPAAYAAELRASAGLPPRRVPARSRLTLAEWATRRRQHAVARMQSQPWWPEVHERALQLRPAWWAVRGVAVAVVAVFFLGVFLGVFAAAPVVVVGIPVAVAAMLVSMRAGAAADAATPRTHLLLMVWNLAAVGALVWFLLLASASSGGDSGGYSEPEGVQGLSMDGTAVSNVYPYDAQGRPLRDVRLYDQTGRPLVIGPDGRARYDDNGVEHDVQPDHASEGPPQWNLYPMLERVVPTEDADAPTVVTTPGAVPPPYERVAPLPAGTPAATAPASPSASPTAR